MQATPYTIPRLRQVLVNLVVDAVEFTEEGGIRVVGFENEGGRGEEGDGAPATGQATPSTGGGSR